MFAYRTGKARDGEEDVIVSEVVPFQGSLAPTCHDRPLHHDPRFLLNASRPQQAAIYLLDNIPVDSASFENVFFSPS